MEPADPDGVLYMGYGVLVLLLPMMSRREWWPARRKHQHRQLRRRRISTALHHCNVSVSEPIHLAEELKNRIAAAGRASLTTFLTLSEQKMYAYVYIFYYLFPYIFLFAT